MNERKTPQAQENMDQANKDVGNAAQNLVDALGEFGSSIGDNLKAQRELNAAKRQDAWNNIKDAANNVAGNIKDGVQTAAGVAIGGAAMAGNAVKETGEKVWNNGWAVVENIAEKAQGKTSETLETEVASTQNETTVGNIRKKMLDNRLLNKDNERLDKGEGLVAKISGEAEHSTRETAEKPAEDTPKEPAKTETQTEPVMTQFDQEAPELTPAAKKQDRVEKAAEEKAEAERLDKLYQEALAGKYGNGDDRKKALGNDYDVIQNRINEHYAQMANAELTADIETPSAEVSAEMQA